MATITIADNDARVQYTQAVTANVTQLTIDFPFFDLDDINVIVTSAAGVDTTLSRGTGTGTFAVTGTSVDDGYSGGYITLGDSYADASTKYTIFRDIPVARTTDFPTSGPFNVSSLNTELDKIFAVEQELETKITRTLQLSDSDSTVDLKLPNLDTRKGTVLAFNATTGVPEAGPTISDVSTIAAITADIATLADIEDGTDATDAIQTVAGISSNVTTVAGISSNVTTVAGISADVTSVAADATDIGTVASNIASVNTVAGNITEVIAVANDLNEAVSEVETVANDLNEAVSEIETVAASISNVDTVGTNISNVNTVAGNSTNINTVAGISSNVTTVAGISANVTTVAGISSDVTTVAADGTDIGTVATNISNVNTVAGISSNVTTVAGNNANVTTVASNIADVNTVAGSITDVNTFAVRYRIASSAPATSLDEGDLYFDTTDNQMYVYTGSAWVAVSPDLVADTTPQLGGNLDTNGNDITFGDGDKAIFGAGSDLEIGHTGLASDIKEKGTGNLRIWGDDIQFFNTAGTKYHAQMISSGAVTLYYNGSAKLATGASGVSITGSLDADGLTVDASNPTLQLTGGNVSLDFVSHAGTQNAESRIYAPRRNTSDSSSYFFIQTNDATSTRNSLFINGGTNDVSLYDSSGVTQGFYWDASAQGLSLRTTSNPNNSPLYIRCATDDNIRIQQETHASIQAVNDAASAFTELKLDGSSLLLNSQSGGNVGIGTAAPGGELHLYRNSTGPCRLLLQNTEDLSYIYSDGGQLIFDSDNGHLFRNENGTTEFGRFDSSGNLLVGKTSESFGTAGTQIRDNGVAIDITRSSGAPFNLNRLTTNGEIMGIYKDSVQVGSIGVDGDSTNLMIGNGVVGLRFVEGSNHIRPANIDTGGNRDNAIDLGYGSSRFKDLYLSGGVYLGGTGASNLLDDYEEGTWTGTLTGGTTAPTTAVTATGTYTKIGRLVEIEIRFVNKDTTGASGDMKITGLPFTTAGGSVPVMPLLYGIDHTNGANIAANIEASGIFFYNIIDNGAWTNIPITAGASKYVYVSATYRI